MNSIHSGHSLVIMGKWTPEKTLMLIEKYRITISHMVPTMFNRLVRLPEDMKGEANVSSLRNIVHSAAPCPVELKLKMLEWWGPEI